jgi:hypothetical protein
MSSTNDIIGEPRAPRKCELIHDELGWHIQFMDYNGNKHCHPMDATDEIEAQHEAMQEGFSDMVIWHADRQSSRIIIPKQPYP